MYEVASDEEVHKFSVILNEVLNCTGTLTHCGSLSEHMRKKLRGLQRLLIDLNDQWNKTVELWPGEDAR